MALCYAKLLYKGLNITTFEKLYFDYHIQKYYIYFTIFNGMVIKKTRDNFKLNLLHYIQFNADILCQK